MTFLPAATQHIHTTLISRPRSFSTFFPLFSPLSPSSFNQAFQPIVPHVPPSINRTHTHTHTHVPFKQANRVRSVLRISSRYSLPPYLCHRFHLLRGRRSPLSPLFTVPLDQQLLPRRLISFHRQTTMSIITSIVEPSSFTDHGRKIGKKRNIYTKLECVYLYR